MTPPYNISLLFYIKIYILLPQRSDFACYKV
nr:MAG TPA: hypothetical protein [Caudoviricetes sp.]